MEEFEERTTDQITMKKLKRREDSFEETDIVLERREGNKDRISWRTVVRVKAVQIGLSITKEEENRGRGRAESETDSNTNK